MRRGRGLLQQREEKLSKLEASLRDEVSLWPCSPVRLGVWTC